MKGKVLCQPRRHECDGGGGDGGGGGRGWEEKERDGKKRSETVSINRPHSLSRSPFISETQWDILYFSLHYYTPQ